MQLGRDLVVADDDARATNGNGNGHGEIFSVQELHEVKRVNRGLERLRRLRPQAGRPGARAAHRRPRAAAALLPGKRRQAASRCRTCAILVAEVRKLGERGMTVTRFKGLGEMDGDELWDTTLDPAKRTLLQVQLDDALKADEMFRTLMGEKVEPRREFIQKHALEVKDIDYHGA